MAKSTSYQNVNLVVDPLIKIDLILDGQIWLYIKTYASGKVVKGDFVNLEGINQPDVRQILKSDEIGQPLITVRVFHSKEDFDNGEVFGSFVVNDFLFLDNLHKMKKAIEIIDYRDKGRKSYFIYK